MSLKKTIEAKYNYQPKTVKKVCTAIRKMSFWECALAVTEILFCLAFLFLPLFKATVPVDLEKIDIVLDNNGELAEIKNLSKGVYGNLDGDPEKIIKSEEFLNHGRVPITYSFFDNLNMCISELIENKESIPTLGLLTAFILFFFDVFALLACLFFLFSYSWLLFKNLFLSTKRATQRLNTLVASANFDNDADVLETMYKQRIISRRQYKKELYAEQLGEGGSVVGGLLVAYYCVVKIFSWGFYKLLISDPSYPFKSTVIPNVIGLNGFSSGLVLLILIGLAESLFASLIDRQKRKAVIAIVSEIYEV